MRHLNEEELIDVAEGIGAESSLAHLESCEQCRRQAADLRAVMSAVAAVEVPEPSPLFWDHLSARVSEAVADVRGNSTVRVPVWRTWRVVMPAIALAAVVVAAIVRPGGPAAPRSPVHQTAVEASAAETVAPLGEDPSLSLIADLAGDLDWDAALDAGLTTRDDAVELVLLEMNADERLELQRILKQALSKPSVS
jgi:hypothetical protein